MLVYAIAIGSVLVAAVAGIAAHRAGLAGTQIVPESDPGSGIEELKALAFDVAQASKDPLFDYIRQTRVRRGQRRLSTDDIIFIVDILGRQSSAAALERVVFQTLLIATTVETHGKAIAELQSDRVIRRRSSAVTIWSIVSAFSVVVTIIAGVIAALQALGRL